MHIQREAGRVTINKQKDKPVSSKAQNPGPSGSAEQYSINQSINYKPVSSRAQNPGPSGSAEKYSKN